MTINNEFILLLILNRWNFKSTIFEGFIRFINFDYRKFCGFIRFVHFECTKVWQCIRLYILNSVDFIQSINLRYLIHKKKSQHIAFVYPYFHLLLQAKQINFSNK